MTPEILCYAVGAAMLIILILELADELYGRGCPEEETPEEKGSA